MAITTCTVSGTIKDPSATAIVGATVRAYIPQGFFHADGTYIAAYEVTTTTDANGAWSLVLMETTSITKTITITFDYAGNSTSNIHKRKDFTIVVPATTTATFSSIATEAT